MDRTDVDILLTNGRVLQGPKSRFAPSAVAIRGSDIADVGTTSELSARYRASRVIDCQGAIVHAGLIEPHLHLLSLPFQGMGLDALSTLGLTYSDVKAAMDPDATRAFALYAAMQLLSRGYTTVCEPGTAFDFAELADGLQAGGINALISAPYCWDDLDMFSRVAPGLVSDALLRRAPANTDRCLTALEEALDVAKTYDDTIQGFVCLYGLGSASDPLIDAAKALARERNAHFNLHQDYTLPLRRGEISQHGVSGTERLSRLGVLDRQTSLTHMVYGSKEDFSQITRSGAGVIWCPLNILQRGFASDATHLHVTALREGVPVAIATDTGLTFSPGAAEIASKLLAAGQNAPLTNLEVLEMQTGYSASCLGISDRTARLTKGMRADIVIRAPHVPISVTVNAPELSGLATSMPVETVIAAGRQVVENGRYSAGSAIEIARDAAVHRDRILEAVNG